ncbi:hypothetical protein RB653_000658 [Dictyostelium firmibasis]|uniref:Uncharacterized protein n=1 Tax=Dictyostelium firmibasis TaxID=79012 RepID=A0AAN7YUH9_9MYCE
MLTSNFRNILKLKKSNYINLTFPINNNIIVGDVKNSNKFFSNNNNFTYNNFNNNNKNNNYNSTILNFNSKFNSNLNKNENKIKFNNDFLKSRNYVSSTTKNPILSDIIKKDNYQLLKKDYDDYFNLIKKNIGLKIFLKNVYITTTMAFTGTLLSGLIFSQLLMGDGGSSAQTLTTAFGLGVGGSFLSLIFCNSQNPTYKTYETVWNGPLKNSVNKPILKNKKNTTTGKDVIEFEEFNKSLIPITVANYSWSHKLAFVSFCVFNGLTLSPVLGLVSMSTVLEVAAMSLFVTGGSAYAALRMKPDSLTKYEPILYGSLFGLLGLGLISIGTSLLVGENAFTRFAQEFDLYFGLALFTGLVALDTHNAVKTFQEGRPDYIRISIDLFLDVLNIFVRLLRIRHDQNK